MTKINVLLVDDHPIMREGLRALLSFYEDIKVVGEAQDGADALSKTGELQPDVVIMDVAMPTMNGLDATQLIHRKFPDTHILILTQYDDRQYVLPLLQAGASGIVLKQALGADLITAIRAVARGEAFLYPPIAAVAIDEIRRPSAPVDVLTQREQEILRLIAMGETSRQIAAAMSLSIKTVEWHRTNLMSKLDLHSVADLVRYAIRNGYADADQ